MSDSDGIEAVARKKPPIAVSSRDEVAGLFRKNLDAAVKRSRHSVAEVCVRMNEAGYRWTADVYSRSIVRGTRNLRLDEALVLAQIVNVPLAELTSTESDVGVLRHQAEDSWEAFTEGLHRVYLSIFDTLNGRSRFLNANKKLRAQDKTFVPDDFEDYWKLSDLLASDFTHLFTTTRVEAMYAEKRREVAEKKSQANTLARGKWMRARAAVRAQLRDSLHAAIDDEDAQDLDLK